MRVILASTLLLAMYSSALAVVTSTTQHSTSSTGLDSQIAVGDLISGKIATELAGDMGWHPAVSDPLDKLPAFTDDVGIRATGLTGLLNDFPGAGNPAKRIQYDFSSATDVGGIQVLTGNNGRDGRVFSTFAVYASTNNGGSFNLLGYFQSDPLGSINNTSTPDASRWGSTLVHVFDDSSATLASGVTNLQFDLYAVDNSQGQYRDPFDGVNPFTNVDDGLARQLLPHSFSRSMCWQFPSRHPFPWLPSCSSELSAAGASVDSGRPSEFLQRISYGAVGDLPTALFFLAEPRHVRGDECRPLRHTTANTATICSTPPGSGTFDATFERTLAPEPAAAYAFRQIT